MLVGTRINGLVANSICATLAAGFSLVFGVTKVPNMACTAFYTLSAYAALLGPARSTGRSGPPSPARWPWPSARWLASFAFLFDRLKEHGNTVMIISVGLALLIQELALQAGGGRTMGAPPILTGFAGLGGNRASRQRLLAIGVSLARIGLNRIGSSGFQLPSGGWKDRGRPSLNRAGPSIGGERLNTPNWPRGFRRLSGAGRRGSRPRDPA